MYTVNGILKTGITIMARTAETRLSEKAYAYLKKAIFEGRLPPGSPLSRRRLAEELDMSAVPVGDAILRLEGEGLIESRPQAGTRVKIATPDEIHGNYVLREALETHSARLFAESADDRFRRRLLAAAKKVDASYATLAGPGAYSGTRRAKAEYVHIAFHMLIAQASKVAVLISEIERSRVLLFNWIFNVSMEFERFPDRWHCYLAEALVNGSPAEAAEAMRRHVRYRQDEVIGRFRALACEETIGSRMVRGPQRRNQR
ncbi:MAG: GntR family transcriptional regulator [Acidobacteria bacterium]|nr:GntR family transcriptional regulator [Acidobacteriota bacterium]